MVPEWIQAVKNFSAKTPYKILFDYFIHLASLESPPYRWWETRGIISLEKSTPFSALENDLERALERVIAHIHLAKWTAPNVEFIDLLMTTLCSFWRPDTPTPIPRAIIRYINERKAESALQNLLTFKISELWDAFPITLATRCLDGKVREQEMMALWRVASLEGGFWQDKYRPVLEAMASIGPSESPLTLSVITMIKTLVIDSIQLSSNPLEDSLLPTETAIVVPPDIDLSSEIFRQIIYDRTMEAKIVLLAEFLDKCSADFIPFKAVETIRCLCNHILVPRGAVHESHQLRLANAMSRLLNPVTGTPHGFELLEATISCQMFELYAGLPDSGLKFGRVQMRFAWLENLIARGKIKDTLVEFITDCPSEKTTSSAPLLARAQVILGGLDSLHIN
jgi:hypothetical protein